MNLKTVGLAPLLLTQAVWVMARASRLPEAAGERHGTLGDGPPRRLLILGDSSAAGVGVRHQGEALAGQLTRALAKDFCVTWDVVAKSGATVQSTQRDLDAMTATKTDLVLVALGVNDTKNGVSATRWQRGYERLLSTIAETFQPSCICVCGVPPLGVFPRLPAPLNEVLGARARRFDAILKDIVHARSDTQYLSMDFPLDPENMASDGFHPSAKLYRDWALRAALAFSAGKDA